MPNLINSNALTFDDILLVPRYSRVASRQDVDISTSLLGWKFATPICSANMDTVTELQMAYKMSDLGGAGILHRYARPEQVESWIKNLARQSICIPSIGIKNEDYTNALKYDKLGALAINIDIAHGDSEHMLSMVKALRAKNIKVIAGNVATFDGALRLAEAGANVIKVGIGPGSLCTTRIVTGHGVPQLTAIQECAKVKEAWPYIKIIADGGIRNSGDCVKALAFGADMVMIGSMLAGTDEAPGDIIEKDSKKFKAYRGMASREARSTMADTTNYTPEGEATLVPFKGPVEPIINQLIGGIRSGFSYSGASSLIQLQAFAEYMIITNNGMTESRPHLIR